MTAVYSDVNQNTDIISGTLVEDVASVYQHIDNLLSTRKRERLFAGIDVGVNLDDWLHEPINVQTAIGIRTAVVTAIKQFLPMVSLDSKSTSVSADIDGKKYTVTLVFKIRGLNERYQYSAEIPSSYGD
jgi:phage baseplate assembly protein W